MMVNVLSAMSPKDLSKFVEDLYEGPVRLSDLQARVLTAASNGEEGGPTPEKDQKIQEIIYNFVQSKKDDMQPGQAESFAAVLAWICVGKEISKLLSVVPKSSLDELLRFAKKSGYDVELTAD